MAVAQPTTTPVERYLQINVAALATMGTIILGFGQQSATLPVMAVFAAVTSVYFSDILGWFRLHRHLANAAAVLALLFCMNDFYMGDGSRAQLFAIANLLIYLQFVLLYQKKSVRLYWQLVVLSLLQVVVSAALNLGVQFGVLLAIYMVVAVGAMTLAYSHQELLRLSKVSSANESIRWRTSTTRDIDGRGGSVLQWAIDAPPVAFQLVDSNFAPQHFLGWGLVRRVVSLSSAIMLIAVSVFMAAPRSGHAWWRGGHSQSHVVGFSDEITLSEVGEALESSRVALRVRFVNAETGEPFFISGAPYLRGAVLTRVDSDGQSISWRSRRKNGRTLRKLPRPNPSDHLVRQEIVAQPSGRKVLFGVYPPLALEQTPNSVRFDTEQEQLVRNESRAFLSHQPFRYVLGTNSVENNWQDTITPAVSNAAHDSMLSRFNARQFPNLLRIANEIVAQEKVDSNDPFKIARSLERHFWNPDLYTYTLSQAGLPDLPAGMNRVEHFIANHRSGHCEYFATSLALMLRSQGIPSRVVVGYHGGDFNSIGQFYQVRDLHAHAWVEAYLSPQNIPTHLKRAAAGKSGGVWLRLDPTPSSRRLASQQVGVTKQASDTLDYMESLWYDYVLNLDSDQQRRSIYEPLGKNLSGLFNQSVDDRAWSDFFSETTRSMGVDTRNWWGSRWFDWSAALVVSVVGGVCVGLASVLRLPLWRSLRRRKKQRADRKSARKKVEFFHQLENLLARFHFHRKASQTIQELSQEITVWLGPAFSTAPLNDIATSYYRVRFGGATLSTDEKNEVQQSMETLKHALESRRDALEKTPRTTK